jgi:hypothetical protein
MAQRKEGRKEGRHKGKEGRDTFGLTVLYQHHTTLEGTNER